MNTPTNSIVLTLLRGFVNFADWKQPAWRFPRTDSPLWVTFCRNVQDPDLTRRYPAAADLDPDKPGFQEALAVLGNDMAAAGENRLSLKQSCKRQLEAGKDPIELYYVLTRKAEQTPGFFTK